MEERTYSIAFFPGCWAFQIEESQIFFNVIIHALSNWLPISIVIFFRAASFLRRGIAVVGSNDSGNIRAGYGLEEPKIALVRFSKSRDWATEETPVRAIRLETCGSTQPTTRASIHCHPFRAIDSIGRPMTLCWYFTVHAFSHN